MKKRMVDCYLLILLLKRKKEIIFIEVKNISNEDDEQRQKEWIKKLSNLDSEQNHFLFRMGVKFKDTILKKWAMDESYDKKIHYIVILEFNRLDANQRRLLFQKFHSYLPICLREFKRGVDLSRWMIYNVEEWNKDDCYNKFPIKVLKKDTICLKN
ncbi:MAG: hypothetical protein QME49_08145 [bacterium]|nr:hypothetical protein [bacterium]